MKVYTTPWIGTDGHVYSVRLLLEPSELAGLQKAGLCIGALELVGMQTAADAMVASFEAEAHIAQGGALQ